MVHFLFQLIRRLHHVNGKVFSIEGIFGIVEEVLRDCGSVHILLTGWKEDRVFHLYSKQKQNKMITELVRHHHLITKMKTRRLMQLSYNVHMYTSGGPRIHRVHPSLVHQSLRRPWKLHRLYRPDSQMPPDSPW